MRFLLYHDHMPRNPTNQQPEPSDESVYDVRLKKLAAMRKAGEDPYPATVKRTHTAGEVREDFKKLEKSSKKITLVGRLMTFRTHGKISFGTLRDASGEFQLAFQADTLGGRYDDLGELDLGDFVEATGTAFTTKRGEPTLAVTSYRIIAKSLRALPAKWHGLKDAEERYRKRYLDMLANPEVREKLRIRSRLITAIRAELDRAGFLELENPVLEVSASGAAARPMKTHLNAYDLDLHLRISLGELWQKRSLVGGFEKIYEIGRAFRNEGVDPSHHPDFTMLEYYWAYADAQDNLKFHEKLIPAVVKATIGALKVTYGGETLDFTPPYPRTTFRDAVKKSSGIDITKHMNRASLAKAMKAKKYKVDPKGGRGKLLDDLFKESFRKKVLQPVFVTNYPAELKPLAKLSPDDPTVAENFQLVVATFEISNSYSELNDPLDQRARFEEQQKLQKAGDDEAMGVDEEFVEALEYGMPPATGTGIGIDRLAALLTDSSNIREVTAYPLMKPKR